MLEMLEIVGMFLCGVVFLGLLCTMGLYAPGAKRDDNRWGKNR